MIVCLVVMIDKLVVIRVHPKVKKLQVTQETSGHISRSLWHQLEWSVYVCVYVYMFPVIVSTFNEIHTRVSIILN